MEKAKKNTSDMVGWLPELESGQQMVNSSPGEIKLKVVITHEGVTIIALSDHPDSSDAFLGKTGFKKDQIRGMLCG